MCNFYVEYVIQDLFPYAGVLTLYALYNSIFCDVMRCLFFLLLVSFGSVVKAFPTHFYLYMKGQCHGGVSYKLDLVNNVNSFFAYADCLRNKFFPFFYHICFLVVWKLQIGL